MARYYLHPAARRDLAGIWQYTAETWSQNQADKYYRGLNAAMASLAEQPMLGPALDQPFDELRKSRTGSHLIIYRLSAQGIDVIRILHANMDMVERLSGW